MGCDFCIRMGFIVNIYICLFIFVIIDMYKYVYRYRINEKIRKKLKYLILWI